jgi:hypothetical protein
MCYISYIMRCFVPSLLLVGLLGCSGVPPEETVNTGFAGTQDPYGPVDGPIANGPIDDGPADNTPITRGTRPPETVFADPVDQGYADPDEDPEDRVEREGGYVGADGRWYPAPIYRDGVAVGRPVGPLPDQLAAERAAEQKRLEAKRCNCSTSRPAWEDDVAPGVKKTPTRRSSGKLTYRARLAKYSRQYGQPDGKAAWYGLESHNQQTTSGVYRSAYEFTAAHATLPMNSQVEVINLYNGKSTRVTINDRTGTSRTRLMVVSQIAATELDMLKDGVVPIRVRVISRGTTASASR